MLPEPVRPDGLGQRAHAALEHELVGPGRAVGDHDRRVRRVTPGQQFLLKLTRTGGRQEQRHRGLVHGEVADGLSGRHRGLAAAEPGEDHRLGYLRNGELPVGERGDGGVGADPRHGLVRQPQQVAELALFLHRAPQRRVAGVDPGHHEVFRQRALVQRAHPLQRQRRGVDHLGAGPGVAQHVRVDQAGGPYHDVARCDDRGRSQRQQVGGTWPGADEPDLGPACGTQSLPPRTVRRPATSSVDRYGAGPLTSAAGRMSSSASPRAAP